MVDLLSDLRIDMYDQSDQNFLKKYAFLKHHHFSCNFIYVGINKYNTNCGFLGERFEEFSRDSLQ